MRKLLASAALLLILSCQDGGGPGPGTPQAASIATVSGEDQVAPAATVLPESLAVIVRDASGAPLGGATVTWNAVAGSVSPINTMTSAAGIARAARTLGPNAGTQTTVATVGGLSPVTFTAVSQIQGATQIGNRSIGPHADTVHGTLTEIEQPLIVLVLDQHGVPVPGVVVQWQASGGGSVAAATGVTNAGGESIMEYTFGAEARGEYGATAAVPGLIGSPVTFTLTAHPATPVSLEKTGGDGLVVQAGGQVVHTVTARDSYGNGVQGVTIDWTVGIGGGSIAPAQNVTATGGRAEATRTLGSGTGEQTTSADAPALPASVRFSTTAAAAVVRVANNAFIPIGATVQVGDSVAWQWQGITALHNITFANVAGAPVDVADRVSGVVWRKFGTEGAFGYQCTNHPGMTGSVSVVP